MEKTPENGRSFHGLSYGWRELGRGVPGARGGKGCGEEPSSSNEGKKGRGCVDLAEPQGRQQFPSTGNSSPWEGGAVATG